jgi:hypothetical protein
MTHRPPPSIQPVVNALAAAAFARATRIAALALVLPLACGDTAPDAADDVGELTLDPLATITATADARGFGRIADIEIGDDRAIYVLDALDRTVHVFDESGAPLRTFGGRGAGPGELERPAALAWGPGGRLWVVDTANGRFTVFDPAGDVVATHPYPGFYPWAIGFAPDGRLLAVTSGFDLLQPQAILFEARVAGAEIEELRRTELDFVQWPSNYVQQSDGMVVVLEVPFSPAPAFRIGPTGHLWYATTGEPWVHRRSADGDVAQTVGREFQPTAVTEAERREVLAGAEVDRLRREIGEAAVADFASQLPATRPHLLGFFLDDQANVWIMRTGEDGNDTPAMDVWDAGGTLLATARAALEPEPRPRVRHGILAGVVRDEVGVESVALYRIRR